MTDLNRLAETAYNNAKKRQENGAFKEFTTRELLKHTATEVVEATEAYKEFKFSKVQCPCNGTDFYKENFASELADIIACVLIIAHGENIDIETALNDCMEKNRKRAEGTGDKL